MVREARTSSVCVTSVLGCLPAPTPGGPPRTSARPAPRPRRSAASAASASPRPRPAAPVVGAQWSRVTRSSKSVVLSAVPGGSTPANTPCPVSSGFGKPVADLATSTAGCGGPAAPSVAGSHVESADCFAHSLGTRNPNDRHRQPSPALPRRAGHRRSARHLPELGDHGGRVGLAVLRIRRQRTQHHIVHIGRYGRDEGARRARRGPAGDLRRARRIVRIPAGERHVEQSAQPVQVGAHGKRRARAGLLGRHERGRAPGQREQRRLTNAAERGNGVTPARVPPRRRRAGGRRPIRFRPAAGCPGAAPATRP